MSEKEIKRLTGKETQYFIWKFKYASPKDATIEDSFRRVAGFASKNDTEKLVFYDLLSKCFFVPGGRILANAGTGREKATMSNCYFVDSIPDSMEGIFSLLKESALIMQAGGGIGLDFSTLRPKGSPVKGTGSTSSGPVSFAKLWDSMCETIESAGSRRGAQIGVMRINHPDIDIFIGAKKKDEMGNNALQTFNLSVLVTDDFIEAVKNDADWNLVYNNKVYKTVRARDLWDKIMKSNYYDWEPGVLFIDRINKMNSLAYCEKIYGTNPCGEQPLPPYNACNLGAFPLPYFISNPFSDNAQFDFKLLEDSVKTAVRFMDNIIDLNYYPLEKIKEEVLSTRRMGLGVIGLTDALSMFKLRYGTEKGRVLTARIMESIRNAAYTTSIELAKEKGAFPKFDRDKYLQSLFIKTLPEKIQEGIYKYGIRNSHLLTVAPTGTTSMFCENMSSGIEPYFGIDYTRSIRMSESGEKVQVDLSPYAVELYRKLVSQVMPDYIIDNLATNIHYKDHILMQSTVQQYVDSSISKTINFPESISYEEFKDAYILAYDLGCKGCTTYRPNNGKHGIIKTKSDTALSKDIDIQEIPKEMLDGDLEGIRKKFKHPEIKHAYYLNFNHVTLPNGKKRPAEIFINTKHPEHSEFTTALTRLISAVMRRTPDPSFIADELSEIQNNRTAFWNPKRRKQVPSLVAEIGEMLRDYFEKIGIIEPAVPIEMYDENEHSKKPEYAYCHKCGQYTLVRSDACEFCINPKCSYDRCG